MRPAQRSDHTRLRACRRCALVSAGGATDPAAQRTSRSGQTSAVPGAISSRNPQPAPLAIGSMRSTPIATKAAAKLSALGFPVKELIGGIEYWERSGYDVTVEVG